MGQDERSGAGATVLLDPGLELLSRKRLEQRWQWGSDTFFWRHQKSGRLVPRWWNGLLRYAWDDVYAFEGGPPPAGLEAAYRCDLLTEFQVAAFCSCSAETVFRAARGGKLAVRRVGRAYRFVPEEVRRWQTLRWHRRSGT